MSAGANNISIAPVNLLWRIEASETIDFTGLDTSTLDGVYFNIWNAKDATAYYVWFNLDAGSVDPAPAGKTAIAVAVTTGDSTTTVASATATAIDGVSDFTATSSGAVVTSYRDAVGAVTSTVDVDSGVTITMCRQGKDFDLGLLQGNVDFSFAPSNFVVTAQQTGLTPRAALFQGYESIEATTVLLETVDSKLKEIYGLYGSTGWTPSSGTEVYGAGNSKQGNNLLVDAARLVFKPTTAANDLTNVSIMLAVPVPDSLVFSGEDPKTLSITWQGFLNDEYDTRTNAVMFGDDTQSGLRA